jgi:hypothetical protein
MIPPPYTPPTSQVRRQYLCCRAPCAPTIDGRLDKPFWRGAAWTEDFVDIEGDVRARPRYRTRAKMVWDDTCLYVGAEMEEPHVWGTLTQRDSIVFHDNDFEVFLNPTGDNHRYYEVEINALNTIFDLFLPKPYRNGGPADHGWDVKGLRTAVHVDGTLNDPTDTDRGWTVELALPWAALDRHGAVRCPPRDGEQWRVNFSRVEWDLEVVGGAYRKVEGRPEHNWVWSPQGIVDMHRPEQWGYVQFVGHAADCGDERFRPDPSLAARDVLHAVYYAQKAFKETNGRWAGSLKELGELTTPTTPGGLVGGVELVTTPAGWTATQRFTGAEGRVSVASIREDSLVRVE